MEPPEIAVISRIVNGRPKWVNRLSGRRPDLARCVPQVKRSPYPAGPDEVTIFGVQTENQNQKQQ